EALEAAFAAVEAARPAADLELFVGLPAVALADVCGARGEPELAADAVAREHARLATVARTIASDERRARFWARRVANDRLVAWALRLGSRRA
ncbi:MAG TPA: hypothetical protein VHB21_09260, partial [Minicystis sp.]|nr:hypothetical protein [Minicystis sp.]